MTISFADLQQVVVDFSDALPLDVTRRGASSVVNVRRADGASTPVIGVIGSVWPVTGESLVYLEAQGLRGSADVEIFTPYSQLLIADDDTQQPGDRITHAGKTYEIIHRQEWLRGPLWHYFASQVGT